MEKASSEWLGEVGFSMINRGSGVSAVVAGGVAGALLAAGPLLAQPPAPAGAPLAAAAGGVRVTGCCVPVRADALARVGRLAPQVAGAWRLDALPATVDVIGTAADLPATDEPASGPRWVAITVGPVGRQRVVVAADAWSRLAGSSRDVVVAHELAHVAARIAARGAVPAWLDEGQAEWLARRLTRTGGVATTPARPPHPGAPAAADFGGATAGWAYATAAAMVDELVGRVGRDGLVDLRVAVAAAGPDDVDRVLRAQAGVDVAALVAAATGTTRG
jgi:hypothetical protein